MNHQIVGIRKLHKDLKTITEKVANGEEFLVVKNSKPAFKIVPIEGKKSGTVFSLKDFQDLQFSSKDKNLSEKINNIYF